MCAALDSHYFEYAMKSEGMILTLQMVLLIVFPYFSYFFYFFEMNSIQYGADICSQEEYKFCI